MSTYVLSDLHGQYDKFMDMLKLTKFNDNDKMYILGDIFDRGPDPLKILDYNKNSISLIDYCNYY